MRAAKYISFIVVMVSLVWVCSDFDFESVSVFLGSLATFIGLDIKICKTKTFDDVLLSDLAEFYRLKFNLLNNNFSNRKEAVDNFNHLYSRLFTQMTSKHPRLVKEFQELAAYSSPKNDRYSVDKKAGLYNFASMYEKFIQKIR